MQPSAPSAAAVAIIVELGLQPHPEGGWYRETWRASIEPGKRDAATAIYFLLDGGNRSHWHRVDAAELWLWHAGDPLLLSVAQDDSEPGTAVRLGPAIDLGERPQFVVPPDAWQAAHADRGWALVSCVVSPAFDFGGFTLAPPGWSPGARKDCLE